MVPSKASTTKRTPSTIFITRSTSPPKSACPGVSRMLIWYLPYLTAVFFDKMVIPRSRSIALVSIARSSMEKCSGKVSDCLSISLTRVVLPWSTWAIIAMFRMSSRDFKIQSSFHLNSTLTSSVYTVPRVIS